MSTPTPLPVDPSLAAHLADARRQTHHAAQLLTAAGISYLAHQPDDSHTNLGWVASPAALASRVVPARTPFRLGLRVSDLTLLMLGESGGAAASFTLHGQTIASAAGWIREQAVARGADAARFTLDKHYTIPPHAVDDGAAFDTSDADAFEQLSAWFAGAAQVLERVREEHDGEEVRCWPHHFDIATLLDAGFGTTIGIGLEPGDVYYDEPYYYVNLNPAPTTPPAAALAGGGTWHTHEWFGAVLRGSSVVAGAGQGDQIYAFIASAISAYGG